MPYRPEARARIAESQLEQAAIYSTPYANLSLARFPVLVFARPREDTKHMFFFYWIYSCAYNAAQRSAEEKIFIVVVVATNLNIILFARNHYHYHCIVAASWWCGGGDDCLVACSLPACLPDWRLDDDGNDNTLLALNHNEPPSTLWHLWTDCNGAIVEQLLPAALFGPLPSLMDLLYHCFFFLLLSSALLFCSFCCSWLILSFAGRLFVDFYENYVYYNFP